MTMERRARLKGCFKSVMVHNGLLSVTINGGKSILLLSVRIWATLIQVCLLFSPLTLLIPLLSSFVAPLTVSNNGSWPSIRYVNRYTSQYSTPLCHYSNESIAACLTASSYYVTSSYARSRYCNTARDTLFIQCDFDMGKPMLTYRCYTVSHNYRYMYKRIHPPV